MREKTKCLKAICGIVRGGAERLNELANGGTLNKDTMWT